tara:strand:+ start:179 stop:892 length:714 start_codon:yes stop_codon:yes gene_type:complete
MLLEKGKAKFDWKPKKGSFKKIQEDVLRKQGLLVEYEDTGYWVKNNKELNTKTTPYSGKDYVGVSTDGSRPPEPTPEQYKFAKKYRILGRFSIPGIDFKWIKKNNMEQVWKRQKGSKTSPIVLKIADEFSKEIKNANGNINQIKSAMKQHFSKSDGWVTGNPLDDYIKLGGITVKANSGIVSVKDIAARKGFDIDLKTGEGVGTTSIARGAGSPYRSSMKPAANEYEAKAGGWTGYY